MRIYLALTAVLGIFLGTGCNQDPTPPPAGGGRKLTFALLPKSEGNQYFVTCRQGADEAARKLGVEVLFDGPTNTDPAKQNEIVENWITLGVDVIASGPTRT